MTAEQFDALLDYLNRTPDAAFRLAEVLVDHIGLEDGRIEVNRYWLNRLTDLARRQAGQAEATPDSGEGL